MTRIARTVFPLALCLCLAIGCAHHTLPTIHPKTLPLSVPNIPEEAVPLYTWHASHPQLFTYWGQQSVSVEVAAYFPPGWKTPGDECWRVEAKSGEDKPLPFIGVIRRYVNENGTTLGMIVPKVDLGHMPDGLYIVMDPKVTVDGNKIVRIEPVAAVTEIRDHHLTPFQFPLPLVPDMPSDLTPAPPPLPEVPEGTPIAVGE